MISVVIKKGKYFNYTYGSVRWDKWGTPINNPIIVCDDWKQGLAQARLLDNNLTLFVNSGTVFNDIQKFLDDLNNYPHRGLIGHIIDPIDDSKFYSLHPQCFLLDCKKFDDDIFDDSEFARPLVERSKLNIHDNYTPLWLRPLGGVHSIAQQDSFGQKILAQQLSQNKIVSNWHQKLRDNKIYLYREELRDNWIMSQQSYIELAEKQLWIFNNQNLDFIDCERLISPASGLFWMIGNNARVIDLLDISASQIDLVKKMVREWNGNDYGSFVYNFVISNKIQHFQLDTPMSESDKIKLISNKKSFCSYVNDQFKKQLNDFSISLTDFQKLWPLITNKKISYSVTDMIHYLLSTDLRATDGVWLSNILEYKYAWIKHDHQKIQECKDRLIQAKCTFKQ